MTDANGGDNPLGVMNSAFLMAHLEKTSRSFYLGIRQLDEPQRTRICLAYLLCRILDSLEDANSVSAPLRIEALSKLQFWLKEIPNDPSVQGLVIEKWKDLLNLESPEWGIFQEAHPYDFDLLREGAGILSIIADLPREHRENFSNSLMPMAEGMVAEVKRRQLDFDQSARTLLEFKTYCYWVAGTVGEFLTRDFWLEGCFSKNTDLNQLLKNGRLFGQALQTVNIIKDFYKDWAEGRCFWPGFVLPREANSPAPDSSEVRKTFDVLLKLFDESLLGAEAFIACLNKDRGRIRFFCSFPLTMAVATLKVGKTDSSWIERNSGFKVSRLETARIAAHCLSA